MHHRKLLRVLIVCLSCIGLLGLAPSARAVTPIQPGSRINVVDLAGEHQAIGSCSVGYVFDGKGHLDGNVYIATAAHCATDPGDDVMLFETGEVFGEYAALGSSSSAATDWALIEVFPEFHDRVSGAFKGYPEYPTGYTNPGQAREGDAVRNTDWPYGGVPRESVVVEMTDEVYVISGPVIPFDSGGPLAHIPSGEALGLVSRGADCELPSLLCETYLGPTVQGVLSKASEAGFPVSLRTV